MTKHAFAKNIFEEIQSRPFSVAVEYGLPCNNCYYKSMELLQKLAGLGYAVRGRIGEMSWAESPVPAEITALIPSDMVQTHFYPEVLEDGVWRIIDPTLQLNLGAHGFCIGSWESGGNSCFPISRLYSQAESIDYQNQFSDDAYSKDYFARGLPAWTALNQWFSGLNA